MYDRKGVKASVEQVVVRNFEAFKQLPISLGSRRVSALEEYPVCILHEVELPKLCEIVPKHVKHC
jgi:hypothetical protein